MTTDLFTQYAQLDPAAADESRPDWGSVGPGLLFAIDERTTGMSTQATRTKQEQAHIGTATPRRWNKAWAAVAAFAVIVIAALAAVQILSQDAPPATEMPAPPFDSAIDAATAYHAAISTHDPEYVHSMMGEEYKGYAWAGPTIEETTERFAFNEAFGVEVTLLECSENSPTSASCLVSRTDPYEIAMFGVAGNYHITVRLDDAGYIASTSWQTAPSEFTKDLGDEWGTWVNSGNTLPFIELFPGVDSETRLDKSPEEAAAFVIAEIERFLAEHEG